MIEGTQKTIFFDCYKLKLIGENVERGKQSTYFSLNIL